MSGFSTLTLPSGDWTRSFFFLGRKKQQEGKRRKNANFNIYSVSVVDSMYIFSYQFQNTKLSNQAENTAAIYYHIVKF